MRFVMTPVGSAGDVHPFIGLGRALRARGHTVNEIDMTSGLQAIQRRGDGWYGGADPRREGVVMGD